jgi:hypothetical protein
MQRPRSSLLTSLALLLTGVVLALAACSSNSVSGSEPKPSHSQNAETKATARSSSGMQARMVEAALANVRRAQ